VSLIPPLNVAMMSLFCAVIRLFGAVIALFFFGPEARRVRVFSGHYAIVLRRGAKFAGNRVLQKAQRAREAVWLQFGCICSQTRRPEGLT
jgi:hypothetical protein